MTRHAILTFALLSITWAGSASAGVEGRQSYPELGVTLGLTLHPSVGYWWGRKGLRFSGMYLDDERYEFHVNFGYVLRDAENVQHSVNLLTSWIVGSDPGADYNYAATGIAYGINYKGFFAEIGLGWPWRDEIGNISSDPVVPVGYWGYIHRFK